MSTIQYDTYTFVLLFCACYVLFIQVMINPVNFYQKVFYKFMPLVIVLLLILAALHGLNNL